MATCLRNLDGGTSSSSKATSGSNTPAMPDPELYFSSVVPSMAQHNLTAIPLPASVLFSSNCPHNLQPEAPFPELHQSFIGVITSRLQEALDLANPVALFSLNQNTEPHPPKCLDSIYSPRWGGRSSEPGRPVCSPAPHFQLCPWVG